MQREDVVRNAQPVVPKWLGLLLALSACAAAAQTFPAKPVRIVVPFPAGGGFDVTARILAQKLNEQAGRSFIVENRVGASGIIGTQYVVKSPADGYTVLIGSQTTQAVVPALYGSKVNYDTVRDFAPVIEIAVSPTVIIVNPSLPVRSVKELIALAKARPGQLTYGAGPGALSHTTGELFKLLTRTDLLFVPYQGEGPAVIAAMGGQIAMVFANFAVAVPHVKSGRMRALAITSSQRVAAVPEIPTAAEAGLKGYEAAAWFGLFVPTGTPRDVIMKLNADTAGALKAPETTELMKSQGLFVVANTPEEFAEFLKTDIPRWTKVVKDAGIKIE